MIGQALGDAASWMWENPGLVLAGLVVWLGLSVGVALVAGPAMAEGDRR